MLISPLITIKFLNQPTVGDEITLSISTFTKTVKASATNQGYGFFKIGDTAQQTEFNFSNAFTDNTFKASSLSSGVIVYLQDPYIMGTFTYNVDNPTNYDIDLRGRISHVKIRSVEAVEVDAGDRCGWFDAKVKLEFASYPLVIKSRFNGYINKVRTITSASEDIILEFPRQSTGDRKIYVYGPTDNPDLSPEVLLGDRDRDIVSIGGVSIFKRLDLDVNYSESSATIIANPLENAPSSTAKITNKNRVYQFSIDGINFQSSNSFEVNTNGQYEITAIDDLGCRKSAFATVDLEERKSAPYFDIEITNPLRLVDQNITGIKNISNQLAANYDIPNVEDRFFRQPFKIGDIIRTQFKSNYSDHEVRVYNCGNLIETITPILKIENTNQLDKRDVILHTGAPNKTNVAFPQGNIYDPITNDVIDTYFQYDGRLPSFVRVGMLLTFNQPVLTGTFEVEEIIFDERLQSWVAVITATMLGSETAVQVLSTYNLEEYNIYEFELTYPEGQYHIEIVATDDNALYPDVLWESEPFFFSDDIDVVTIDYTSNVNQSLIDYRTDIEFRLCVPGRFAKYQPTTESETFKDDLGNLYLQKNTYNRMWEVETSLIPWWIAEKLIIASKHKILKIDGISVVNSETPEVTDRLGERNPFYQVIGMYQENIDISVTDETGIISGARGILGGNENQVIGI